MIERWTLATFFFASLFHSAFDDMMIDLSIACTCAYLRLVLGVKFDRLGLLLTSSKIKIRNFELRHCIVSIQSIVLNMNQVTLLFYDQQVVYICISRTKKINRIMWEVVSFLLIDLFSRTYKNHFIFKFLLVFSTIRNIWYWYFFVILSEMDCSNLNKLKLMPSNTVYSSCNTWTSNRACLLVERMIYNGQFVVIQNKYCTHVTSGCLFDTHTHT